MSSPPNRQGEVSSVARRPGSSVQVKITLVIFVAVLAVASVLAMRDTQATRDALIERAETNLAADAAEQSALIEAATAAAIADLRALRETPPVQGLLRTEDSPDGVDPEDGSSTSEL